MTKTARVINRSVVINDLTAQANPLRLGQLPTYAWRPGYVHKYASLWVTALRFFILNRPDFSCFASDLCKNRNILKPKKYINIDSYPTSVGNSISIDFFVDSLRENRSAFRWSNLADFPVGFSTNIFLDRPAICLTCISHGFHSPIFSLQWFSKCPLHEEHLIYSCPYCGKSLTSKMREKEKFGASICQCGNQWMSIEMARCPPPETDRDNVLTDIVKWIEGAANRCWLYLPYSDRFDSSIVAYRHLSLGLSEYNEQMPAWIKIDVPENLQFTTPRYRPFPIGSQLDSWSRSKGVQDRIKIVSESGFVFYNLSKAKDRACSFEVDIENINRKKISSHSIFKSMMRYAIKHLLGKRVHLIQWVANNQSVSLLNSKMQVNHYIGIAWAILHWMRASFWGSTMVDRWLKGLLLKCGSENYFRSKLYSRNYKAQRVILAGAEEQAELWIENRINASSLLDLFPTQHDLEKYCTDEGFLEDMVGIHPRPPLEWWAWCGADRRLRLAVMQRQSVFWHRIALRSPPKNIRIAAAVSRQLDLHNKLVSPAIEFGSDDSWNYRADLSGLAHGIARCSRLVMGNKEYYRFCVAELPQKAMVQGEKWVLRCLDLPLLVFSNTTREGVIRLKQAARFYLKTYHRS